jgi:hypothetical protein
MAESLIDLIKDEDSLHSDEKIAVKYYSGINYVSLRYKQVVKYAKSVIEFKLLLYFTANHYKVLWLLNLKNFYIFFQVCDFIYSNIISTASLLVCPNLSNNHHQTRQIIVAIRIKHHQHLVPSLVLG